MLDLLMNRRSIRKYKDQKIEKEIIDKIIQGILTSPSGRNLKPWEFIVITEKDILKKLGDLRGRITQQMGEAPLGIVIIADPEITDLWIEDASIATTITQLMSQSLGLGSCWMQLRDRIDENDQNLEELVKDILNIPGNYRVEAMVSIGYPDEEKEPYNIDTLPFNKVHYNKF